MNKSSKSSSKILPVNIVKDNNLPPDLIVVDQKIFDNPKFKEKFGIELVSKGTANFQPIGDIARVDNLYIELVNNYYLFDINKIDELFLVEESRNRDNFTNVILSIEGEFYEFPYGNIKVRVGGSTSAYSSSAKASSSPLASAVPETIKSTNITDIADKMPISFFRNKSKNLGEYIVNGIASGKLTAIQPRLVNLKLSSLEQPVITDHDLQFYVLNPPINNVDPNQVYNIYQLNVSNVQQKQYVTNAADGVTGVLFTYKDSEQLAVRMDQLYYKKELAAKSSAAKASAAEKKAAAIGLSPPPEKVIKTTTSSSSSTPLETIDYNVIPANSLFSTFLNNNTGNKSVVVSRNFNDEADIQGFFKENDINKDYDENFNDKLKMDEFFFYILIKNNDDTFTIYKLNESNIVEKRLVLQQESGISNPVGVLFSYNKTIQLFEDNRSIFVPFRHLFSKRKVPLTPEEELQIAVKKATDEINGIIRTNGARFFIEKEEEFKIVQLKPLNPDGFVFDDNCFELFLCLPGSKYYIFINVQSVGIDGQEVTINYIDTNDNNREFRMQTNIDLIRIWDGCGGDDEMEEPDIGVYEDYENADISGDISESNDTYIYEDDAGVKVPVRIIKSIPGKSGPMISFKNPTSGKVTTVPLTSIKPGALKVKKQPKKTLIVFTPLDYKHYLSYKSMYSVYFVINSNILFEIPIFYASSDLKAYPIEYTPVAFIPTDKFFGYLTDYDFDTRTDGQGYYHTDYNNFKKNDTDKKDAGDNYNLIKGQIDSISDKIQKTYDIYNKKKADLQRASIAKKTAENNARPVGGVVDPVLQKKLVDATKLFNDTNNELTIIQNTITTDNADKQRLEKALVKAAKVVDDITTRIKQQQQKAATVSKQLIFLVNKKYLKTQANAEYILIDYKSKYKINPFIDKNITNFNYNIYDIYKKYPDFCKIFFHEYNREKSALSIGENIEPLIRIGKIEFIPEIQNNVDAGLIVKLKGQIQPAIKDYKDAYKRYNVVAPAIRGQDALSNFIKALDKTTSIYTKLVDFDNSDFKQTIGYLDDEDKLYIDSCRFLQPANWDDLVRIVKDNGPLVETRVKNMGKRDSDRIQREKTDALQQKADAKTPAAKTLANQNLNRIIDEEIEINNNINLNINTEISNYITIQTNNLGIIPSRTFYETVIKRANFVKSKCHRFLKEALELKEKSIQLQNKSDYYANEATRDPGNQVLYTQLSQNNMDESTKLLTESNELIYKLNSGQDELNTLSIVCKILVVLFPNSIGAGVITDVEILMIKCNMLEILGNIIETQGLIAEKIEENNEDALKYYQKARSVYTETITYKSDAYREHQERILYPLLVSGNDNARNSCNISRILKKEGDINTSNQQLYDANRNYTTIFDRINTNVFSKVENVVYYSRESSLIKILYDYAMFLITTQKFSDALKYLQKADSIITPKIKDLGPYNLYVMNIKQQLDYLVKTLEAEKYFHLFDNTPGSYAIEYTDDSNKNITKDVDSQFLFLQYSSNQSDYATDLFIPIPVTKIVTDLEKQLDDDLYKTYEADKQSHIIIYTDKTKPDDNFILTKIEPAVNQTSAPPQLTSGVMKNVIGGAGKSYETEYFTEFGGIKSRNIDEDSLFIIKTPQVNTVNSSLLKSFLNKTTTFFGNVNKWASKPVTGTAKGLSSAATPATPATVVNQTSNIKTPEIVPNELFIVMNTSIPGSQKIYYSPKMTIKESNAKSIRFDPLVELDQSVINKVPKDLRIKQFFDKGLFESLINLHGLEKVRTLIEAMNDGIINNNILVTLNTIFAINTPIYISGEVYYIADVQWTQGDWAIDTKEKPVSFDVSKIKNPYIYSAVVNDDIISGQSQLKALSKNVLTGANYKGPPPQTNATLSSLSTISPLSTLIGVPVAQGLSQPQPIQQGPQLIPVPTTSVTPPAPPAQNINVQVTSPALEAAAAALAAQAQAQTKAQPLAITSGPPPSSAPVVAKSYPAILPPPPPVVKKYPALPSSNPSSNPAVKSIVAGPPAAKGVVAKTNTSKIRSQTVPPIVISFRSQTYTNFFRTVFGRGKGSSGGIYYTTMNLLYQGINDARTKNFIKTVEQALTTTNVKSVDTISKTAYDKTVTDLRIATIAPDGNCFFEAIATAINNYNYTNQEIGIATRIGYEVKGVIYGGSTSFNQETIRFVVFDFLKDNKDYLLGMLEAQKVNLVAKNNDFRIAFERACGSEGLAILTPGNKIPRGEGRYSTLYSNVVTSEYNKSHPGFASKTERNMPIDTTKLYEPFTFIDGLITGTNPDTTIANVDYSILEQYITQGTRYWGDATAIDAVNSVLKINTIVIKKGNQINTGLTNSISSQITGVFTNNIADEMKFGVDMTQWSTFLFLYYIEDLTKPDEPAHYELFTFLFPVQTTGTDSKGNIQTTYPEQTFTIFNKNDIKHPPPLYMLLLIFGFKYMSPGLVPADFDFFTGFNETLDASYKSIISRPGNNPEKCKLLNVLYDLFLWSYLEQQINDAGCIRTNRNKKAISFASGVSSVPKTRRIRRVDSGSEGETSAKEETGYVSSGIDGGAGNRRTRRNYNYNNNYNRNYNNNYPNNFLKRDAVRDLSKIGYYISIDLELKKGSPLTPEEIKESQCTRKWNSVRKSFANFTGRTYTIPPVYDYSNKKTLKNRSNNKPDDVTKSKVPAPPFKPNSENPTNKPTPPPPKNLENPTNKTGGTRKNEVKQIYLSGKHNKTIKKL